MKEINVSKNNPPSLEFFFVKSKSILEKISINEILFIHSIGNQCFIQTIQKKHSVIVPLSKLALTFKKHGFHQCHRNYLVQLLLIDSFDLKENKILLNNFSIPVSRKYKQSLLKHLDFLI